MSSICVFRANGTFGCDHARDTNFTVVGPIVGTPPKGGHHRRLGFEMRSYFFPAFATKLSEIP